MKRIIYFLAVAILMASCGKDNGDGKKDDASKGVDYSNTREFVLVDMGGSVKWATMNLGAEASWEIGDYFQLSLETLSGNIPQGGISSLHVPTQAEWEELYLGCNKKNTAVNGMNGFLFTSKTTGNKIFIPAAGYQYTYPSTGFSDVGEKAQYWTSTFYVNNGSTLYFNFTATWTGMDSYGGTMGFGSHPIEFDHLTIRLVN